MSESTTDLFKYLAKKLLDRDGRDMADPACNDGITRGLQLEGGKLRVFIEDGFMKADIPSNLANVIPGFRCSIYDEEEGDYSTSQMYAWIPKLQNYFVLERLADL